MIQTVALGILAVGLGAVLAQAAAPASPQNLITGKAYLNIGGVNVTDLTGNAKFPDKPDVVVYLPYFEWNPAGDINTPANNAYGENYGVQMSGYFYPPVAGDYIFWVCADDGAALYLSTDDNPANKKLIAQEQGWSNPRQWETANGGPLEVKNSSTFTGTQWATKDPAGGAKITLQANRAYYIEGLMKEAGGGDNLAVAVAAPNGSIDQTLPIPGKYLAPFGVSAAPTIIAQPQDAAVYAGGLATFFVGLDIPPTATLTSIKWTKNGVDIPNSNAATVNVTAALADNGAKIKAIVTTSAGTLSSSEATLNVASFTSEFAPGVAKFEAYTGISGTAIQGLLDAQSYIDNKPNDVRLITGIDSPNAYGDNYGAKVSGFVIPPESGQFRFFIRSDDASQFWLSTDDKEANAVMIAEETGCCRAFTEPDSARTSEPIALVAGRKYAFYALVKEGGGGDYLQVAARKEGVATAASALRPLSGSWIGANAKPNLGDPQITRQPQGLPKVIDGSTARLNVDGIVTPTAYNFPIMVQWQKNGQPIAGATAKELVLSNAKAADSGTYRAVVSAPSGKSVTSADAVVAVVPDTFPPVPSAGAIPSTTAGTIDIGIGFDEPVDSVSAGVAANYSVSPGTLASVQFYTKSQSALLKVTGLAAGASTTVTVKNVADLKGNKITTATVPVTVSSKMKWGVVGAAELGKGNWVVPVSANGFDVYSDSIAEWATYDEATFVFEEVTGDFDKMLRVEYQDNSSQWARAGLIVREVLNFGMDRATQGAGEAGRYQKCHVNPVGPTLTGPGTAGNGGWETNRRLTTGGVTSASGGGGAPVPYPNAWCRIKRTGSTFEMFRSSDGVTWISLGSTTFDPAMPAKLYVGPEFAPENGNITNEADRDTWLAKIRDYGDYSPVVLPKARDYGIGLNFGADESGGNLSATDIAGVTAVFQGNWNGLRTLRGTNTTIVADNKGKKDATTVTVVWNSNNTWASTGPRGEENNKFPAGPDKALMTGYLDTGSATTTSVTISGLPSNLTSAGYDVYVYLIGGVAGKGGGYRIVDATTKAVLKDYVLAQCPTNSSSYVQVPTGLPAKTYGIGNYIVFSGLNTPNITVEATTAGGLAFGSTPRAPINAIQLIAPASSAPPIKVSYERTATGLKVTFTGTLQSADVVTGPWTDVAGASSPADVPFSGTGKFYRSKK